MKGFIRQRGSAWELRVYLGADPVTGKQRNATKTVRAGKREAQRVLNEMKVEAERGLTAKTTATVGEVLDRWLELARADFSPKTRRETFCFLTAGSSSRLIAAHVHLHPRCAVPFERRRRHPQFGTSSLSAWT